MDSRERHLQDIMTTGVDLDKRRIYLTGEVTQGMAHRVIIALHQMDSTEGTITFIVNSEGGEEIAGYAIYDAIIMVRNQVVMEGIGSVFSIMAAIFQAGDLRRMSPNSVMMIHNGSIGTDENMQQNAIMEMADQIVKNNKRYHGILANASKMTYAEVEDACEKDSFFTVEECVKNGLCDEIIPAFKKKATRKRKRSKE